MRVRRFDIAAVRAISWDVDGTLYSTRKVASRLWFAILSACLRGAPKQSWAALAEMRRFRERMELLRSTSWSLAVDDASIERRIQFERRWLCPAIAAAGARPESPMRSISSQDASRPRSLFPISSAVTSSPASACRMPSMRPTRASVSDISSQAPSCSCVPCVISSFPLKPYCTSETELTQTARVQQPRVAASCCWAATSAHSPNCGRSLRPGRTPTPHRRSARKQANPRTVRASQSAPAFPKAISRAGPIPTGGDRAAGT